MRRVHRSRGLDACRGRPLRSHNLNYNILSHFGIPESNKYLATWVHNKHAYEQQSAILTSANPHTTLKKQPYKHNNIIATASLFDRSDFPVDGDLVLKNQPTQPTITKHKINLLPTPISNIMDIIKAVNTIDLTDNNNNNNNDNINDIATATNTTTTNNNKDNTINNDSLVERGGNKNPSRDENRNPFEKVQGCHR